MGTSRRSDGMLRFTRALTYSSFSKPLSANLGQLKSGADLIQR